MTLRRVLKRTPIRAGGYNMEIMRVVAGVIIIVFVVAPITFALVGMGSHMWRWWKNRGNG
jgi:hypothetical protein